MTRSVDFDALRAETAIGEPIEVQSGEQTFHLHPEMPWEFAVAWDDGRVDDALASVLPADEVDGFRTLLFADKPSRKRALGRLVAIWDMGESMASSRSSANGGTRSRPTSKPPTS